MRKFVLPLIFVLAGTCFVTYSFLDTFVIPKNVRKVNLDNNIDDFFNRQSSSSQAPSNTNSQPNSGISMPTSSEAPINKIEYYEDLTNEQIEALFTSEVVFKEREHYSSPNIYIDITTHRDESDKTTYYVGDIRLKDLKYLKTALAHDTFGENVNERTSDMCKRKKGILAINGDYYGAQEAGYVVRNGTTLRSSKSKMKGGTHPRSNPEDLAIYADGSFEVFNENERNLDEITAKGAWQVFSFGPGLVEEGEIAVSQQEEVDVALAGGRNQRTVIGLIAPLHYCFVATDGRSSESEGFSLYEMAQIMKDLHCYYAYNLDGGGSSTMYFDDGSGNANGMGHLINKPVQTDSRGRGTGAIQQREISDIVYIGEE